MNPECPEHGSQPIVAMGPRTITLACGYHGNTDGHTHKPVMPA